MTPEGPMKRMTLVFDGPAKGLEDVEHGALQTMARYNAGARKTGRRQISLYRTHVEKWRTCPARTR